VWGGERETERERARERERERERKRKRERERENERAPALERRVRVGGRAEFRKWIEANDLKTGGCAAVERLR